MKREKLKLKISLPLGLANCSLSKFESAVVYGPSSLEEDSIEGDTPVFACKLQCTIFFLRVELLGNAAQSRW